MSIFPERGFSPKIPQLTFKKVNTFNKRPLKYSELFLSRQSPEIRAGVVQFAQKVFFEKGGFGKSQCHI